ncbi:MAG: hypothetical protein QOE90_1757 [Thermoplasmata archaeon]|jgi:hypothetical protein|nr:hypothetical protein [Thermoplasmata archaeon]
MTEDVSLRFILAFAATGLGGISLLEPEIAFYPYASAALLAAGLTLFGLEWRARRQTA